MADAPELRRSMGLVHATAMVVGTIIGRRFLCSRRRSPDGCRAIVLLIGAGFVFGASVPAHVAAEQGRAWWTIAPRDYALALIAGLFTFGGWHMVTYSAEETVTPRRTIPTALLIGVLVVTLCYIALNAAYLYVLPLERVAASTRIAADAASVLVGPSGAAAMSALVVFSTFGALNGIILTGPRVYFAMARDGLLFRWVAGIHPRFDTPHRAIVLQAVWSSVLVATGTDRQLVTRVIYTEWIFFGLMAVGIFLLRRRPDRADVAGKMQLPPSCNRLWIPPFNSACVRNARTGMRGTRHPVRFALKTENRNRAPDDRLSKG